MSNFLPNLPVARLISDPLSSYIYAGTWAGVYISTDLGNSWSRFGNGLPNVPVLDLRLTTTKLQIVTYGRGVWEAGLAFKPTTKPSRKPIDSYPTKKPNDKPNKKPVYSYPTMRPNSRPNKKTIYSYPSMKPNSKPAKKPLYS